jgi:membrane protein
MVYYALVSLVPLLLLVLAGLGLLLRFSDQAAVVEQQVLRTVEASLRPELRTTIEGLLDRLQRESVVATFVSLSGLLLTGSKLISHLRLSFRAIWKYAPPLVSGSVGDRVHDGADGRRAASGGSELLQRVRPLAP